MSSPDRRIFVLGFAAAAVAGCGFTPLYAPGGGGEIYGDIALQEAVDPETFAYRERLRRRLGDAGESAGLLLSWSMTMEETGVAITPASDTTRYQVTAAAEYRLVDAAAGAVVAEGRVRTSGAYDATAEPQATRAARQDERRRLATELAELTATRLLAGASG